MTPPDTLDDRFANPGAQPYRVLFVAYLVFVLYGSLVPFSYHPIPWHLARDQWATVFAGGLVIESRSDFTANILLFIPLSFFLVGALTTDRRRLVAIPTALIVVALCALLSASIEFAQLFFPPRALQQLATLPGSRWERCLGLHSG